MQLCKDVLFCTGVCVCVSWRKRTEALEENSEEAKKLRERLLDKALIVLEAFAFKSFGFARLKGEITVVSLLFPFGKFFADVPRLFPSESYESDLEIAEGCFRRAVATHRASRASGRSIVRCRSFPALALPARYFENMFREIEECRAFELLRNSSLATNDENLAIKTFILNRAEQFNCTIAVCWIGQRTWRLE